MITPEINPYTQFVAQLAQRNVTLPVRIDDDCHATVVDAQGRPILTVDVGHQRPDDEAFRIADWIMTAINTCGGFRAQIEEARQ